MIHPLKILAEECRSLRNSFVNDDGSLTILKKTDNIINHIEDLLCEEIMQEGEIISSYTGPDIKAELVKIYVDRFDINVSGDMWHYSTCMKCDEYKALNIFNTIISARQILKNFDKPITPRPALVPGVEY